MSSDSSSVFARPPKQDHRVVTAARKRHAMRAHILAATMRVVARRTGGHPVIDHVVSEAGIARGTFYKYFDSLDAAVLAVSEYLNDQFVREMSPMFRVYQEPWQKACVAMRLQLTRAYKDKDWARFLTRTDAWSHDSVIGKLMRQDYLEGMHKGQFADADDPDALIDVVMGALAHCFLALVRGVEDEQQYIDTVLRAVMRLNGADAVLCEKAVAYSRKHLEPYINGEMDPFTHVFEAVE